MSAHAWRYPTLEACVLWRIGMSQASYEVLANRLRQF
jgi:hypothetical protein